MNKTDLNKQEDQYYIDWLNDNEHSLKDDFAEDYSDLFNEYCKTQFNDWGDER